MTREEMIEKGNDAIERAMDGMLAIVNSKGNFLTKRRGLDNMLFSPTFDCNDDASVILFNDEDSANRTIEEILEPQNTDDDKFITLRISRLKPFDGEETVDVDVDSNFADDEKMEGDIKDSIGGIDDDDDEIEIELDEDDKIPMTLDDAIAHATEQSEKMREKGCDGCAEEHLQLAEWLKELKELRGENNGEENEDKEDEEG